MPVENGQQNTHRWWGELTLDKPQGQLKAGQKCIFFKTNRDSHLVTQGTRISKVGIFSSFTQGEAAVLKKATAAGASPDELNNIKADLGAISSPKPGLPYVEILGIDYATTTPLVTAIIILTESLFSSEAWLKANRRNRIGDADIRLGLKMP